MADIRQSHKWANYLTSLGWHAEVIDGVFVYTKKLLGATLIKVQRPEKLTEVVVKKIETFAIKEKALFLKFDLKTDQDEKLLKSLGYGGSTSPLLCTSTIIVDLTVPVETLWKNMKKDARYSISYAKKRGLKTTFVRGPKEEGLVSFHHDLLKAGRKKKIYVQPLSDHKLKLKAFGEDLVLARTFQGDKLLSADIALINGDETFLEHFFSSDLGKKLHSTYFELWGTMLYLKENGFKRLDFEGIYDDRFPNSTKNWLGFTYFKRKFGGQEVQYPRPRIKYFSKLFLRFQKALGQLPL